MSHLTQILFLFYNFIFALNQERKTVSVKEYAYDIIYINLKCPDNIIKLLVAVFLKVLIFGHFPLFQKDSCPPPPPWESNGGPLIML